MVFDPEYYPISELFLNSDTLSSYSPKFEIVTFSMLHKLIKTFALSYNRPTAQMVSSIFRHRMRPVVEQTGKAHVVSTWRVDPHSLIFLLKGTLTYDRILPYNKELLEPQRDLLTYIMKQLYSKDLVIKNVRILDFRVCSIHGHTPTIRNQNGKKWRSA